MKTKKKRRTVLIFILLISLFSIPLYAKDDKVQPKEYGVYIKTQKSLVRLMPNMVYDERGVFYIESNKPARFILKDVGYFIIYGQYEMNVLTFNSLLFFQPSPLGKQRYIFGKDIDINVKKQGTDLYAVKQKSLLSRGYYCLWINDTVWDFIIE